MLITCPDCQKQISDLAPACPNCGRPGPFEGLEPVRPAAEPTTPAAAMPAPVANNRQGTGKGKLVIGLVVAILVIALGFLVFGSQEDGEESLITQVMNKKEDAEKSLVYVFIGGKFGYINAKGEMVIPARFDVAVDFTANGLARIKENGKWGYINAKGEMVIPARFDYVGNFAANGLAYIKENGKWGYINAKNEMVIPARFDNADDFAANGLAKVRENGKWGYINAKGEMVIPARFDDANDFAANGLARVVENGKYGYINAKNEMAIPARLDDAWSFAANGLAYVKENGKWGYINAKGQTVVSYDKVCDTEVLKNAQGEIIWPQKTSAQICEEQPERERQKREAEERERAKRQREAEERAARACDHVYVGKEFVKNSGEKTFWGGPIYDKYIVRGVSPQSQLVTVYADEFRWQGTREVNCSFVP